LVNAGALIEAKEAQRADNEQQLPSLSAAWRREGASFLLFGRSDTKDKRGYVNS